MHWLCLLQFITLFLLLLLFLYNYLPEEIKKCFGYKLSVKRLKLLCLLVCIKVQRSTNVTEVVFIFAEDEDEDTFIFNECILRMSAHALRYKVCREVRHKFLQRNKTKRR